MGNTFKIIKNLRAKLDVKEIEEAGFGEVLDSFSGLDIFFTKTFGSISGIEVSASNNILFPVVAVYEYVSTINPVKFRVFLYAIISYPSLGINAGDKVTGSFSWRVKGTERVTV